MYAEIPRDYIRELCQIARIPRDDAEAMLRTAFIPDALRSGTRQLHRKEVRPMPEKINA